MSFIIHEIPVLK